MRADQKKGGGESGKVRKGKRKSSTKGGTASARGSRFSRQEGKKKEKVGMLCRKKSR